MPKLFALLACILFVASAESSRAAPPDSPGTVYVDGVPCNLACQSYMAWSRRVRSQQAAPAVSPSAPLRTVQPAAKTRTQRTATKTRANMPSKAAPARVAKNVASKPIEAAPAVTNPQLKSKEEKPAPERDKTASTDKEQKTASPEKADAPAVPSPASGPEAGNAPDQVRAGLAEDSASTATAPPPPEKEVTGNTGSDPSVTNPANADSTALALAKTDERIAIVVVNADIKSISDLAYKVIAINEVPSSYSAADIKSAIVAAGATDVLMSENQTMALTRLIEGDVQAAIATVVSPAGADAWNSFPGFNVIRVPLPSSPEKDKRG